MRKSILLVLAAVAVALGGCGSGAAPPPGYAVSDGWITKPSGLRYKDEKIGSGYRAENGSYVTVEYKGWLDDGTVFDSSEAQGKPFSFTLGEGEVIQGWDEGLLGLREGAVTQLIIPPDLGYGSQGTGSIPPNSTLHFRVEIISVG